MDILEKDKNFIDCKVGGSLIGEDFFITWVYEDPDFSNCIRNWGKLSYIGRNQRASWTCEGDFNDISNHREKVGGRRKEQSKIGRFNSLIEDI